MAIANTFVWIGGLGSDWQASVPGNPFPVTNWQWVNGLVPDGIPSGAGDLALINLGGDVAITGLGSAEEIQVVNATTVTFTSGGAGAGANGAGGLLVDGSSEVILPATGQLGDTGLGLDVVGGTGDGSIAISAGGRFADEGLILGNGTGATGSISVDGAGSILEVVQSAPGAANGVMIVGNMGDGDISAINGAILFSASASLGVDSGSSGDVTLNTATWGGGSLSIGLAGTGNVTVEANASLTFGSATIGPDGDLIVSGTAGSSGLAVVNFPTLDFGTIDVSGGGEMLIGGSSVPPGSINIAAGASLVGLGLVKGNLIVQGTVQAIAAVPGALTIDGNITGGGTIEPLMTLEVNGVVGAGIDIAFSPPVGAAIGDLVLDVPSGEKGTITGFSAGNTIDVQGSRYSVAVFSAGTSASAGTLTLSGGMSAPLSLPVAGNYASNAFTATPGATDTVVTLVPCFAAGTLIRTEHGDVPVEALRAGDHVRCLSHGIAPIVWIGRRHIDLRRHPEPRKVWPVRVTVGAFGLAVPRRDLFLSPDHAVFAEDVLIPIQHLINGITIEQVPVDEVTYYHIELPRHDVIYAEELPTESYLDVGDRSRFSNGGGSIRLYPDFLAGTWEAFGCAPLVVTGREIAMVRRRLAGRTRLVCQVSHEGTSAAAR